jgi:hypothetical protein
MVSATGASMEQLLLHEVAGTKRQRDTTRWSGL